MYDAFYKLKAEPFRLSPDHSFCYQHKVYAKARAYLVYAFRRAEGFVMITGRPGTGKTTLISDLIETLPKSQVVTANLVCTQLQADELLKSVAYSFSVGASGLDKAELLQRLQTILLRWYKEGRRALLIVDEAQDLSISAMEELRLLTNMQVDRKPLLQIFLLGQPELRDLILSPQLEQVHQRIVAASHLDALRVDDTEAYIRHRLDRVGWRSDPALSRSVYPLIHKYSEGIPRRINMICSRLLLHGCVEDKHQLGVADLREVLHELQSEHLAVGSELTESDFRVDDVFDPPPPDEPPPVKSPDEPPPVESPDEPPPVESPDEPPPVELPGDDHDLEPPTAQKSSPEAPGPQLQPPFDAPADEISVGAMADNVSIAPPLPDDARARMAAGNSAAELDHPQPMVADSGSAPANKVPETVAKHEVEPLPGHELSPPADAPAETEFRFSALRQSAVDSQGHSQTVFDDSDGSAPKFWRLGDSTDPEQDARAAPVRQVPQAKNRRTRRHGLAFAIALLILVAIVSVATLHPRYGIFGEMWRRVSEVTPITDVIPLSPNQTAESN